MHNALASVKNKTVSLGFGWGEVEGVRNMEKKSQIASVLTNFVKGEKFKLIV